MSPAALNSSAYRAVFHTAPVALLVFRVDGLLMIDANQAYLDAVGMSEQQIIGRHVFDVFPNNPGDVDYDQATDLRVLLQRTIDSGRQQIVEGMRYDIPVAGGFDVRWWNVVETPMFDDDGNVELILHFTEDVTLLRRAQEELVVAEAARDAAARQVASLAELALSLTAAESLEDVERIVIGTGLRVIGSDGGGVVSREPTGNWRVTMSAEFGFGDDSTAVLPYNSPLPGIVTARAGQRMVLPDRAAGLAFTPEMAEVYEAIDRTTWAFVPLMIQGASIGTLCVSWIDEHPLDDGQLDLLDGFAAQCAQALHRIELADARRAEAMQMKELAEALQQAMLTPPPEPPQLQIAVRYRTAVDVAQVGGDWYDAFQQPDGATMLVIGDVCGHDNVAAAQMGQLRGLLRALAYDAEEGGAGTPAQVLTRVEHVARGLTVDTLATCVLARVDAGVAGRWRQLRWSNAGNAPPVLLHVDGTIQVLDPKPDLLLGVDPSTTRHDHVVALEPGATFLMYTDGLVERRGEAIDQGIDDLCHALADLVEVPIEALCDRVLERLAPHTGEDDIALLAVRAQ